MAYSQITGNSMTIASDGSSQCVQHSDCNYFDCRGVCDMITNTCQTEIANNNLQAVCEKIFLPRNRILVGTFLGGGTDGLLSSKHSNKRVRRALEKCANPSKSSDPKVRLAASNKVELYRALEEVMSYSSG